MAATSRFPEQALVPLLEGKWEGEFSTGGVGQPGCEGLGRQLGPPEPVPLCTLALGLGPPGGET